MNRVCPRDGTVLDGGPVVFWCSGRGRDVHGSCAPLAVTHAPHDRVAGRASATPEAGPARHAHERAAGRGHAPAPGRASQPAAAEGGA